MIYSNNGNFCPVMWILQSDYYLSKLNWVETANVMAVISLSYVFWSPFDFTLPSIHSECYFSHHWPNCYSVLSDCFLSYCFSCFVFVHIVCSFPAESYLAVLLKCILYLLLLLLLLHFGFSLIILWISSSPSSSKNTLCETYSRLKELKLNLWILQLFVSYYCFTCFFMCLENDDFLCLVVVKMLFQWLICIIIHVSFVVLHYILCIHYTYTVYRYIHCMSIQLDFSAFCVLGPEFNMF